MKNVLVCKSCSTENAFYNQTCTKCKSYLREKIYNIDLWSVFSLLIESPTKAFTKIIYSEHKNFITFLFVLIALKSLIIARFMAVPFLSPDKITSSILISGLLLFLILAVYLILISYIHNVVIKSYKIENRFKDLLAIHTFSFSPLIFSLFILFPLELVIYGPYLFSNNPYPFQIKETVFYILLSVEILVLLYCFVLQFFGFKVQTKSNIYSFLSAFIGLISYLLVCYLCSKFIFSI